MSVTRIYTLNELRTLMEQKSEFNARLGNNVERDDKQNNKEGVEDILKDTERVSGRKTQENADNIGDNVRDDNKTTLHVNFDNDPGKQYKDRVEQLAKYGTPHKMTDDEKNIEKNGGSDFRGNEDFYEKTTKHIADRSKRETELKFSGLKSHNQSKENFKNNTLVKEGKTMKRLHFKNTRFLSEAQLIKKVPEEYKVDGNRFYMRDNTGTDYLVECKVDNEFNHTTINILNKINKTELNEQLNRMRNLSKYESGNYFSGTSSESRKTEDNIVGEMIDIMKRIENNK